MVPRAFFSFDDGVENVLASVAVGEVLQPHQRGPDRPTSQGEGSDVVVGEDINCLIDVVPCLWHVESDGVKNFLVVVHDDGLDVVERHRVDVIVDNSVLPHGLVDAAFELLSVLG